MVAPQNDAFVISASLKFTSHSNARSNTARYRSALANEVATTVASRNWDSFSSAPVNSFHRIDAQSGGGAPRRHRSHQLMTSYHRNPLPPEISGSASIAIVLWLKAAEGNCARSNHTLLNGMPEKFAAYSRSPG